MSIRRLPLFAALTMIGIAAAISPTQAATGLANTTVLIVRHAEKPADGPGLAPLGEKRAEAYVDYFQNLTSAAVGAGRPLRPQTLIATADSPESARPGLTLKPLAAALHLPLDQRFKDKDYAAMVQALETEPHGAVVLIAWHHGKIAKMLTAFGADPQLLLPAGKWPEDRYDWLIELPFDADGKLITDQARRVAETEIDQAIGATASAD